MKYYLFSLFKKFAVLFLSGLTPHELSSDFYGTPGGKCKLHMDKPKVTKNDLNRIDMIYLSNASF